MGKGLYWLTPVAGPNETPVLSSFRFAIAAEEGEALFRLAHAAKPFLLPVFKLRLLIGDRDAACGPNGAGDLRLEEPGDVTLRGALALSGCGAALLERLPEPRDALAAAKTLPPNAPHLGTVRKWWLEGHRVVLLKDE